jgi:UDP-3-O-[3-hydroxymyristoyl] glucosamine N-acyltransferase
MPGPLTLGQIAARLGGRVAGDGETLVSQVESLEHAGRGQITFFSDLRLKTKLAATRAAAVIVSPDAENLTSLPRIVCDKPYVYFARVSQLFNPLLHQAPGVHATAVISDRARLGQRVSIGAGCVVGDGVSVGDDSCLYPRVVVYPGCTLGARVIVHAGAVIGADGFGNADDAGRWLKIPQAGGVRIGDDVEIGANTTIDRGTLQDTVVEEGVKLDNLIQVGHNVRIGAHTAIAACTGIAGSTDIGRHCMIGGAAMIGGHLKIVDNVVISGGTAVPSSILEPGTYTALFPLEEKRTWARNAVVVRRIAELADRVRALEGKKQGKGRKKNG